MDDAPPPESTSLHDVINTLPERRLRNLFNEMCERNADFGEMARSMLSVTLNQQEDQSQPQTHVPVYKTCVNCRGIFDVTKNIEQRCRYHPGKTAHKNGFGGIIRSWLTDSE